MKKQLLLLLPVLLILSCTARKEESASLNDLAEKYVRLGLAIGQYDKPPANV